MHVNSSKVENKIITFLHAIYTVRSISFIVALFIILVILPSAPPITAMVTANLKESLMVGQTGNTLTCNVSGADNLNPTITYQWTRNDQPVPGATTNTFNFSPLRLSQAGVYTCSATVGSSFLSGDINANAGNPQTVMIQSELMITSRSTWHMQSYCSIYNIFKQ